MAIKIKGKKVPYQIGGNSSKRPWKGYARGGTVDENDTFDPSEGGQIPRRLQHAVRNPPKTWTPPAPIRPQRYAEGGEVEWQDMGLANPSFNERWLDRAAGAYARRAPSSTEIKALFRAGNESPNRPPDRDFSGYNLFGELKGTAPEDTPVAIKTKNPHIQITEGDLDRGMDVGMGSGPGIMVGKYGAHMLRQAAREAGKPPVLHPVYAKEVEASAERLRPEFRDAYKGWQSDARDAQASGILEMRSKQGSDNPYDMDVWKGAGWSRGTEGMARKEIPDIGAKLQKIPGTNKYELVHPAGDFHKVYDIPPIEIDPMIKKKHGANAAYDPETHLVRLAAKNPQSTGKVLHEFQHGAQNREGFAGGSAPQIEKFAGADTFMSEYFPDRVPSWHKKDIDEMRDVARKSFFGLLGEDVATSPKAAAQRAAFDSYRRSAGETEARNVPNRRAKSFRYQTHPEFTEDIPRGLQHVEDRRQTLKRAREMDPKQAMRRLDVWDKEGVGVRQMREATQHKPPQTKVHDARDLRNIAKSMVKGEQYRTIKMRDKFPFPEERASGGQIDNPPWFVRNEARMPSGMLKSDIPGRTDKIPLKVAGGSYVLPADIPSALGQGNTMAGGTILEKMFTRGPYGMNVMRAKSGTSTKMARMSSLTKLRKTGYAAGGELENEGSDIIAAGGEYILSPQQVAAIGGGDMDVGHQILDEFVKGVRKEHIQTLKKLPGPKKD